MAMFRSCNEKREGFVVIALAFVEQAREVPVGKIVLRKGVGSVGKSLKDVLRLWCLQNVYLFDQTQKGCPCLELSLGRH